MQPVEEHQQSFSYKSELDVFVRQIMVSWATTRPSSTTTRAPGICRGNPSSRFSGFSFRLPLESLLASTWVETSKTQARVFPWEPSLPSVWGKKRCLHNIVSCDLMHRLLDCSTLLYLLFALVLGATCTRDVLQTDYLIAEKVRNILSLNLIELLWFTIRCTRVRTR